MIETLKAKAKEFKPQQTARVVDGKLILSFPKAQTPILWQMDLSTTKISALEIATSDGGASLILKSPNADTMTIATFDNDNEAVEHLIQISQVLGRSGGKIRDLSAQADSLSTGKNVGWFKKLLMVLGGIVLALVVLNIFIFTFSGGNLYNAPLNNAGQQSAPPQDGVPLSADDFLTGQ